MKNTYFSIIKIFLEWPKNTLNKDLPLYKTDPLWFGYLDSLTKNNVGHYLSSGSLSKYGIA